MDHPLLASVGALIDTLAETSVLLSEAARWADRDRHSLSPLWLALGGPMKYWKWRRARQRMAAAIAQIDELRVRSAEARALPDVEVDFSTVDMINDLYDAVPFNLRRVSTPGGPSPLRQQLGVETNALNQIETSRVAVEHLLSEVGLLHARLRRAA
jgi:hypothetical protein